MKLEKLLENIDIIQLHADPDMDISGVNSDSRKIRAGDIFIAVRGYESDGHRFVGNAVGAGAACVVCEEPPELDVPYVVVRDSAKAMALVASNFYNRLQKRCA